MLHDVDFLPDVFELVRVLVHLEFLIDFYGHQLLDLLLASTLRLSLFLHVCLFLHLKPCFHQRFFFPQHQ